MTGVRELLVLEHTAAAGASAFVEVLDSRRSLAPWRRVDVPAGEPLPDHLDGVAGLVVMGGTMSAVDPDVHPWMPPELALLRSAVEADVPVLGVCLGAQMLGQALGGVVAPRRIPAVGFAELVRTRSGRDDEVAAGWPDGATALFVHEDEVATPPPDAVTLLTGTDGTPAWRVGSAHALQFHPEVTAAQLASWIDDGHLEGFVTRAGVDAEDLKAEAHRRAAFSVPLGRALLGRWLDGPVRRRA